jgi:Na+/proline symporter
MIDFLIIAAFVVYSVAAGMRARREASRGLEDYFLAGRSVRGWRAGVSMAATQYAADTPLLVAGLVAVGGVFSLWRLWIYGLAFLVMGYVLGRCWRRANVLTDAELVEIRYSERGTRALRALKAVYYGTVINCVVMAFVLAAATRIFEVFLPWHLWLPEIVYEPLRGVVSGVGLELASGVSPLGPEIATTNSAISIACMLSFVALYSMTGGLRGVIATDVVQFGFMMIGTACYTFYALRAAGGRDAMLESLRTQYGATQAAELVSFVPPASEALIPFLAIIGLQWIFQVSSDGTGPLAQRTMSCPTDRDARQAAVVFTFAQIVLRSLLWLPIAIALLVIFPMAPGALPTDSLIAEREILFARGIDELMPPGLRGLMLTALLAALASTVDTHLNWGASYWSNDLYKGIWVEGVRKRTAHARELVLVARASTLGILTLSLAIMATLGSIQTAWQTSLLFGAGIGGVLVLRWTWERINLQCEVAAIAVSLVAAPLILVTIEAEWLRLLVMAAVSTTVVVATALSTRPTERERLVAFYERVQPPGFWARTAVQAGERADAPRRRLVRDVALVACAAACTYGTLIGLGLLLLQPQRWPAAVAALLAAALAVPLWRRIEARTEPHPAAAPR